MRIYFWRFMNLTFMFRVLFCFISRAKFSCHGRVLLTDYITFSWNVQREIQFLFEILDFFLHFRDCYLFFSDFFTSLTITSFIIYSRHSPFEFCAFFSCSVLKNISSSLIILLLGNRNWHLLVRFISHSFANKCVRTCQLSLL